MNKKNKTILLVDDEPNIIIALEFLMEQQGYRILKAYDGQQALHTMNSQIPDLIILDVMMPEMDGFAVANQIRQQRKFQDVQIVFLTAKGTQKDKWKGYKSGGEVYLTKPFDNENLVSIVNELLEFS